jgi:adenosine kinase
MNILIYGSLAYDRITEFPEYFKDHFIPDKLDEINVCFMVNGMVENFGGTAGNIAYAYKLMGGEPEISAAVGIDHHRYFEWLHKNGISTSRLRILEDEWTASAFITTDKSDNQITCFNSGAMQYSSELDFDSLDDDTLLIISPGNLDDMIQYPQKCAEKNIDFIFDPGQALPLLKCDDILNCIDSCKLLMVNDYELNLVLNKTMLQKEEILERAGSTVVTLGDHGSLLYSQTMALKIPAFPARKVVDPTGAGDAYRGGLLKSLAEGKSLEEGCRRGSVCASFAVECYGTQVYSFSQDQFDSRLGLVK